MARTGTAAPAPAPKTRRSARTAKPTAGSARAARPRNPELAWLRAGDVRLVISHQVAQDRRILAALDTLVRSKPQPTPRRRTLAA